VRTPAKARRVVSTTLEVIPALVREAATDLKTVLAVLGVDETSNRTALKMRETVEAIIAVPLAAARFAVSSRDEVPAEKNRAGDERSNMA